MSTASSRRRLAVGLVLGVLAFCSIQARAQNSARVIFEERFEGAFVNDPFCREGTCNVPAGWGVWFVPQDPQRDAPRVHLQPNYGPATIANSSAQSQRVWVESGAFTGGLYRVVSDLPVGTRLRLTARGRVWSTNDDSPISARPSRDIRIRIGIDPVSGDNGKRNPLGGQVVWSKEDDAKDQWVEFSVEAEARSSTVVVFLYSSIKDPVRHNEVYWDDVRLESVTLPPPTPPPSEVQPTPTLTADSSPTPSSTGVTYTVKSGDTLFGIALAFNTTVDELLRNNPTVRPDVLQIGQVLVIKPAPEPTPVPPTAISTPDPFANAQSGQPVEIVLPTPAVGTICVEAFFDDNGNGRREDFEDLVPNINFEVTRDGNSLGTYITTGLSEPYCFENLPNGPHVVRATVVDIYYTTSPVEDRLTVAGDKSTFSLGLRRKQDGSANIARRASSSDSSVLSRFSTQLAQLNVSLVLLVAAVGFTLIGLVGLWLSSWMRRNRI